MGRNVLLAVQICVAVWAFTLVDLVEYQAVPASHPFIHNRPLRTRSGRAGRMAALNSHCSWTLRGHHCHSAGHGFFDLHTILPIVSTLCFVLSLGFDRGMPGVLDRTYFGNTWLLLDGGSLPDEVSGHFLLIKAYSVPKASTVNRLPIPSLSLHQLLASGPLTLLLTVILCWVATVIVGAGLFAFWRERQLR